MFRRGLSLTLLVVLAVQLLGVVALASVCFEPCPDDGDESACPPVCSTCATCSHSRVAIVGGTVEAAPVVNASHAFGAQVAAAPSPLAADIFHVPLPG